jgi:hypothetical protein
MRGRWQRPVRAWGQGPERLPRLSLREDGRAGVAALPAGSDGDQVGSAAVGRAEGRILAQFDINFRPWQQAGEPEGWDEGLIGPGKSVC